MADMGVSKHQGPQYRPQVVGSSSKGHLSDGPPIYRSSQMAVSTNYGVLSVGVLIMSQEV